jgi:hypothetical protein
MSDPMTNVEVEDVMTSIRRLVSDDVPKPRRVVAGILAEFRRPEPLLLTPALRVVEKVQVQPLALTPMMQIQAETKSIPAMIANQVASSLEERIAELEAAVSQSAEQFEPDGGDEQGDNAPFSVHTRSQSLAAELRESMRLVHTGKPEPTVVQLDPWDDEPGISVEAAELPESFTAELVKPSFDDHEPCGNWLRIMSVKNCAASWASV